MANPKNEKVLMQLKKLGDTCEKPRLVRHWSYFKTAADRQAYISELRELNYKIEYKSHDRKIERRYWVCFSKMQPVEQDSIDKIFAELDELAEEYDGEYDGWETEVLRSIH